MKVENGMTKYSYNGTPIDVYTINGLSNKTKIGKNSVKFIFNEELGFVNIFYNANNEITLELKLVDVP